MPTNLPTNIDATYIDDATDPSKKIHQQQHDIINSALNALSDPTAADTYTARAYADGKMSAHLSASDPHADRAYIDTQLSTRVAQSALAPVALAGGDRVLNVTGATFEFDFNTATSRYELVGTPADTAAALVAAGHRKVFTGPAAQHPKNITLPVAPVFHKNDRFKKVG